MRLIDFSELAGNETQKDQTFEFVKMITLQRNNAQNKPFVLHKVESRFPYCDNWKEKYNSTKNENNVNNK